MSAGRGLGRGLGALIGANEKAMGAGSEGGILEVDINEIEPNPGQPRKHFDEAALGELAESIRAFGVIQPLVLNRCEGYYCIVAGERRWRAARLAGLRAVPAVVRQLSDAEVLQVALIENIQRRDLNPIEEALCYKRLVDEFLFTHEEVASKVGRSRNSISYAIGLLGLPLGVQNLLVEGLLTPGHARFLLQIKDAGLQQEIAERVADEGLTTRQTEEILRNIQADPSQAAKPKPSFPTQYANHAALERDLRSILGAQVHIKEGKKKGRIEIEYQSPDELDRLLGIFRRL